MDKDTDRIGRVMRHLEMLPLVRKVNLDFPPMLNQDDSIRLHTVVTIDCFQKPPDNSLRESVGAALREFGFFQFQIHFSYDTLLDKDGEVWTVPYF
ncbi:MAG: hypothetical protein HZB99_01410 [Candidatus Harrisonbacteria bacterium]|nr:hypothetical protein [Candidatus Harrisonbacteria bacterium]